MKNIFKVMFGLVVATALVASAAPKYPFPQNRKHPYGTTALYANPDVVKQHFLTWKKAWYNDKGSELWIHSPEGTGTCVSEAIGYGMLMSVYMSDNSNDYEGDFKKLWTTWKNHAVTSGGGMNWKIGNETGSGTATDADVDAALALVMAYYQWGNEDYKSGATTLIKWILDHDIEGGHVKAGNQWNPAFNPSYGALANFHVFKAFTGDNGWDNVISTTGSDLRKCQHSTSGLVPDWCSGGNPTRTDAQVAQEEDPGFYDDAARTPWRTAWAYYWFGDANAKAFNEKIGTWALKASKGTASGINSGYSWDGTPTLTKKRNYVSSTFSGGVGLAVSSMDKDTEPFLSTVYKTLSELTSCATAQGCGDGSVEGERYYHATLNVLYLLLLTGNMPNLMEISKFTQFTPDESLAPSMSEVEGMQMTKGDSTVGISGYWNWGAYHDKLGIGTVMSPDSGTSPLYYKDGGLVVEASMEIGPEPKWTQEAADAGTLKYPSAGIAMSFLRDDKKGVNLTALGVKSLKVTATVSGPMRLALLYENEKEPGSEPGAYFSDITNTKANGDYTDYIMDLTPSGYGTKDLHILDWVDSTGANGKGPAAEGSKILQTCRGIKVELKDKKGGVGGITIKALQFLDASGNVVDPVKIVGFEVPEGYNGQATVDPSTGTQGGDPSTGTQGGDPNTGNQGGDPNQGGSIAIHGVNTISAVKISTMGQAVQISNAKVGTTYAIFDMQGKVITVGQVLGATHSVTIPTKGMYMVRVGSEMKTFSIK